MRNGEMRLIDGYKAVGDKLKRTIIEVEIHRKFLWFEWKVRRRFIGGFYEWETYPDKFEARVPMKDCGVLFAFQEHLRSVDENWDKIGG